MKRSLVWAMLVLSIGGCGDDEKDTSEEADTDTDTDAEEDELYDGELTLDNDNIPVPFSSSELDVQVSATLDEESITGNIVYSLDNEGPFFGTNSDCDNTIAFTGSPYAGECEGCDFAFSIDEALLTEGTGTQPDCEMLDVLSFIDSTSDVRENFFIQFESEYVGTNQTYNDLFRIGFGVVGYTGTYRLIHYYEGITLDNRTFSYEDGALSWTYRDQYAAYRPNEVLTICETNIRDGGIGFYNEEEGALVSTSTLSCGGDGDIWTLTDVEDRDRLQISVDTVASDSAFDPELAVNADSGCTFGLAFDTIPCSFPPATGDGACPSLRGRADGNNDYQIIVWSAGGCAEGQQSVEYELSVSVER